MPKARYHFNIRPEPEGGFTPIVSALPRLRPPTAAPLAEARKMARHAISGYIESLQKHNQSVPTDHESWSHHWIWNTDLESSH